MNWTIFTIGLCLIIGYFLGHDVLPRYQDRRKIKAAIERRKLELEGKV